MHAEFVPVLCVFWPAEVKIIVNAHRYVMNWRREDVLVCLHVLDAFGALDGFSEGSLFLLRACM